MAETGSNHPRRPAAAESIGNGDCADEPPLVPLGADVVLSVVLNATRALLWIETAADASAVARDLVEDLGGVTVAALASTDDALPVDLSFGVGGPVLPAAPRESVARMLLERHLPIFVRDAQRALELADQTSRLTVDASIDSLTGLANRRMLSRALGRLRPGDTVIMIDLDHFKAINDTVGHQEGDRVLRILGQTLAAYVRARDRVGRYGGEEFVVIASESLPSRSSPAFGSSGRRYGHTRSPSPLASRRLVRIPDGPWMRPTGPCTGPKRPDVTNGNGLPRRTTCDPRIPTTGIGADAIAVCCGQ